MKSRTKVTDPGGWGSVRKESAYMTMKIKSNLGR